MKFITMPTENHHLSPAPSRKERIDRWFNGSWKSAKFLFRSRSREISDEECVNSHQESPKSSRETFAARQIIGPNLDPVLVEDDSRTYHLGYLCDIDHQNDQVLVDSKCFNKKPQWIKADKVYAHFSVDRGQLGTETPIMAAVRDDCSHPYTFRPAKLLFIDSKCRASLLYIETLNSDGTGSLVRKFVHPHQLRVLSAAGEIADLVKLLQVKSYPWRYRKRTIHLDSAQDAEKITLEQLLDAMMGYRNTHCDRYVMRIRLEKDRVHFFYKEHSDHPLSDTELKELVKGVADPVRSRAPSTSSGNGIVVKSEIFPLDTLPLKLQQRILMEIDDIHSIISAQRVCKAWYEILHPVTPGKHAAIELNQTTTISHSRKQDQNDGFHQLVNILSNIINETTVSLTLIGNLNADLELAIYQFFVAKKTLLPMIILRNSTCWRPLAPHLRGKVGLEFSSLNYLMSVCQTLSFRNVMVPSIFGPTASMWSSPAKVRTDIDIFIPEAYMDCTKEKGDLVVQFLWILNENCPEMNSLDRDHVGVALNAMIENPQHPFYNQLLLMLNILHNAQISHSGTYTFHQQSLSKLAAHAFKYSYPAELVSRSPTPLRSMPKMRSAVHDTEGIFASKSKLTTSTAFNGKCFFSQSY